MVTREGIKANLMQGLGAETMQQRMILLALDQIEKTRLHNQILAWLPRPVVRSGQARKRKVGRASRFVSKLKRDFKKH